MALYAYVGELGTGKTLGLTYMALRNWLKGKDIYSNYKLNFPPTEFGNRIIYVRTIDDIQNIGDGFACLDELWLWLDSRASGSKKNKIISVILSASRKMGFDIGYTTQSLHQIDKRVRDITDMLVIPQISGNGLKCTLYFVKNDQTRKLIRTYRFPTELMYNCYNTREIIRKL